MRTEIGFILDNSVSMFSVKDATIEGVNSFIESQRREKGKCNFSLIKFATITDPVYWSKKIKEVDLLNEETYSANGGSTALLDAIGTTINELSNRISSMKKDKKPDKVIVVIQTDGHENNSREFTYSTIVDLINRKQTEDNWEFI